jgi:hypothetical protein
MAVPYHLSYKAAWYLLALDAHLEDPTLWGRTLAWLVQDQRPSGGWGPWRSHPATDDFLSTGLAMWALAEHGSDPEHWDALQRAVQWCARHQQPNGLLPGHFIEECSGWVLLGWMRALSCLQTH